LDFFHLDRPARLPLFVSLCDGVMCRRQVSHRAS
jgi:hypothetical protein